MTTQKIEEHKNKLEKERFLVASEIKEAEKPVDFGSDIDHFDEEADEAEEMGNQISITEALKARLNDIDIALSKIQNGKFGICEKCKKEIDSAILEIDPESRFCKSCKSSQ